MVEEYMSKEARLKAIREIISDIDSPWILWQIHRVCVNILRGGAA